MSNYFSENSLNEIYCYNIKMAGNKEYHDNYSKDWHAKNRHEILLRKKKHYEANKDKITKANMLKAELKRFLNILL